MLRRRRKKKKKRDEGEEANLAAKVEEMNDF
jgi:hypothetical protein